MKLPTRDEMLALLEERANRMLIGRREHNRFVLAEAMRRAWLEGYQQSQRDFNDAA